MRATNSPWAKVILLLVFGGIGVGALVAALLTPDARGLLLYVGALFLLIALILLVAVLRGRRETGTEAVGDLQPVVPLTVAGANESGAATGPAPVGEVAARLAGQLAGTPYVVTASDSAILATIDLADNRWWHLLQRHGLTKVFEVLLVEQEPGTFVRQDRERSLEWYAACRRRGRRSRASKVAPGRSNGASTTPSTPPGWRRSSTTP